ncbi:MAG: deoxyuridine 5'-triphosphate nucleotidohydrolase [bacterium]
MEKNLSCILSSQDFSKYLQTEFPLVTEAIFLDEQIQPNGIELTLKQVMSFETAGFLEFSSKERVLSETKKLEFDQNDWLYLKKGCYKIIFNEILNIPNNLFALARPRSSLLRMGVSIETALWDSGYSGRSESLLIVHNFCGLNLKKNARLIQLVFFQLENAVKKCYKGIYKNENIEK